MARRILIIDGHPDPGPDRFCHQLVAAYAKGSTAAGHVVHRVALAEMTFPLLTTQEDWENELPCAEIRAFQDEVAWAEHVVIVYPLWLGSMPARLKGLLEQAFRPGFAFGGKVVTPGSGRLKGRSVRIIVTMGMPGPIYRVWFAAHSLRALERNILALVGFGPIRDTVVGAIKVRKDHRRLLTHIRTMGERAA